MPNSSAGWHSEAVVIGIGGCWGQGPQSIDLHPEGSEVSGRGMIQDPLHRELRHAILEVYETCGGPASIYGPRAFSAFCEFAEV